MFMQQSLAQEEIDKPVSTEQTDDETAVKAAIEAFLFALGTNDTLALPTFFLPNANIGSIRVKDGKTSIYTNTVAEWLAERAQKENKLFEEPVQEFTVEMTQGRLAFVRANTTLLYNGVPSHYAHDFFILMKDEDQWKILSGSYTNLPLVNE
jgi:hypothetical protein